MSELEGRCVVVGVSGGIAAYKAAELVSRLAQEGAVVRVVLTHHATQFVGPVTFQALSGNPVYTETFAAPETYGMGHLSLAGGAAALVVAPATANLLAKAAHGLADDLLSTTLLSVTCPVILAPAMNEAMWRNPLVQANVAALRAAGHRFVGPESGWLACRQAGEGRMAEVAHLTAELRQAVWPEQDLAGRRVLVTAGPTREPLDAVRFLSNPSTGKQGYALAEAARIRGAEVVLVSGPTTLPAPWGIELVQVGTAAEMLQAVRARCHDMDLLVGAAAVGDWAPLNPAAGKPAKSAGNQTVELAPTEDIIAAVAAGARPRQVVVGFAAEVGEAAEKAAEKLRRKRLDLIVANDVSSPEAGFAADTNQVTLIDSAGGVEPLPPMSKREVGHAVCRRAAALLAAKAGTA